jgi:carbamoyl-phosphate synthase large subunit
LVPTIDPELAVLSQHAARFAAVGTRVVVSAPGVVAVANDKLVTARILANAGIPTPKTLPIDEYLRSPGQLPGPVIAKPNTGSASIGIVRPNTQTELSGLLGRNYLVQEQWSGREYTVNVFFDGNGTLKSAVPHWRIEVRSGEVSKGRTERVSALTAAAEKLARVLPGARGPLCFQAIVRDSGDFAVFEINARFGGGFPLAHRAGARFSQWLLEEACGLPSSANDDWKEGVTMLRYDSAVFLDE